MNSITAVVLEQHTVLTELRINCTDSKLCLFLPVWVPAYKFMWEGAGGWLLLISMADWLTGSSLRLLLHPQICSYRKSQCPWQQRRGWELCPTKPPSQLCQSHTAVPEGTGGGLQWRLTAGGDGGPCLLTQPTAQGGLLLAGGSYLGCGGQAVKVGLVTC